MHENIQHPQVTFFDSIAHQWDTWEDLAVLRERLDAGLLRFGLHANEHVLDVGCGTGNLTGAILRRLSPRGRVTAIDLSSRMIEVACQKVNDVRVEWICQSLEQMSEEESVFDRVICYSVWPHMEHPERAAQVLQRVLKPGGRLHIWHLKSREVINEIHAKASEPVCNHILVPATQTAALLAQAGFTIEEMQDDETGYLVSAKKG